MDEISIIDNTNIGVGYTQSCILYRLVHQNMINKLTGKPSANMFNSEASGLSCDWDRYTNPDCSLIRTGLTFKHAKKVFKSSEEFLVFSLPVNKLREIQEIQDIIHTPEFRDHQIIGDPENLSHTSVFYIDEEIRLKLVGVVDMVTTIDRVLIQKRIEEVISSYEGNY